jgi:hypothetical protein
MDEDVEITLHLPEEMYEQLLEIANVSGQSVEDIVRVTLAMVMLQGVEDDPTDA